MLVKGELVPVSLAMSVRKAKGGVWNRGPVPRGIGGKFNVDADKENPDLPDNVGGLTIEYVLSKVPYFLFH